VTWDTLDTGPHYLLWGGGGGGAKGNPAAGRGYRLTGFLCRMDTRRVDVPGACSLTGGV
jgi:hypothetical protein